MIGTETEGICTDLEYALPASNTLAAHWSCKADTLDKTNASSRSTAAR